MKNGRRRGKEGIHVCVSEMEKGEERGERERGKGGYGCVDEKLCSISSPQGHFSTVYVGTWENKPVSLVSIALYVYEL